LPQDKKKLFSSPSTERFFCTALNMQGTRVKTRTDSTGCSPTKRTKKGKKTTDPTEPEETHTCKLCQKVYTDKNERMLQCERCEHWVCLTCTTYSDLEYKVLADRVEFHWFCQSCEKAALQAVHVDQEIRGKVRSLHESNDRKNSKPGNQ